MARSKQQPLTAERGRSEHDFAQSYANWEAAVFDRAAYFAVIKMKHRFEKGEYLTFTVFPWAVRYAQHFDDRCVYAVAPSGRFTALDRDKWNEWIQRWQENRVRTERTETQEATAVRSATCL